MTADWDPGIFRDEYRDALMKLVEKKVASGQTEVIESDEEETEDRTPQTINFMDVLKRSVAKAGKNGRTRKAPAARKRAATPRRRTRKKKAG
jgi:DNA end-binding protein Ku